MVHKHEWYHELLREVMNFAAKCPFDDEIAVD